MTTEYFTPQVIIPTITSVITGGWILKDFLLKREFYPKVKIESNLKTLAGPDSSGSFAALLTIKVSNHGVRRLYFNHGEFTIRCLPSGDDFSYTNVNGVADLNFRKEIISRAQVFPKTWEYSWVDGADHRNYNFTILVPPTSGIISVKTKISLREKRSDFVGSSDFFSLSDSGIIEKIKTEP